MQSCDDVQRDRQNELAVGRWKVYNVMKAGLNVLSQFAGAMQREQLL